MKTIFYILLLLPSICFSQAPQKNDDKITIGTKISIRSSILNEDKEVWVYEPASAKFENTTRYPITC